MLFLEEISQPGEYNLQFLQFFTKKLHVERLFDALREVCRQHEILRTRIRELNDQFYQEVLEMGERIQNLRVEKVSSRDLKCLIHEQSTRPFDLLFAPPLRVRFFDITDKNLYWLFLEMHHIVVDATTTMLIEQQISRAYNGESIADAAKISYAQWSIEQRSSENVARFERMAGEMVEKLAKFERPLNLREHLANEVGDIRVLECVVFESGIKDSTPFAWFCTQLARVFSAHFHQSTVIVGAPAQNRNEETERTLGNFLNNILIPLKYEQSWSFTPNLQANARHIAEALKYSELPYNFVAKECRSRDVPLYDVYVNARYDLENEQSLEIAEKCEQNLEEYLPRKCHHLLEIDIDAISAKRAFRVKWRTRSHDRLIDELFRQFRVFLTPEEISIGEGGQNVGENPLTDPKATIRRAFRQTLEKNVADFNDRDDYFSLGGTSLSFVRLYRILKREFELERRALDATSFISNCSVESIHEKIEMASEKKAPEDSPLKVISKEASTDLFIFFPTLIGGLLAYRHVFDAMQSQNAKSTILGLEIPTKNRFDSIDDLAELYSSELLAFIDKSKIHTIHVNFIGASLGALLAYETARRMKIPGFSSLISIDGIANSNIVNSGLTPIQHRQQIESTLVEFQLDRQTMETIILDSWRLLQLTLQHNVRNADSPPHFHLFLLMIAKQSTTKHYGWPVVSGGGGMYRLVRIDGDHLTMMMDGERGASLAKRILSEIHRAKNSKMTAKSFVGTSFV